MSEDVGRASVGLGGRWKDNSGHKMAQTKTTIFCLSARLSVEKRSASWTHLNLPRVTHVQIHTAAFKVFMNFFFFFPKGSPLK